LDAFERAVASVEPGRLVQSSVSFRNGVLRVRGKTFAARRVFAIGFGKASGAMAEALERAVPVAAGVVVVPQGSARRFRTRRIRLVEGTHPLPTAASVSCAKELLALARKVREGDAVVCLISGGGSSLLELPRQGLSLSGIRKASASLMKAGASISELNEGRRCLSQVKGGHLGLHFGQAVIVNLVLSDVLGSPLQDIASGPTVSSTVRYATARKILEKRLRLPASHSLMRFLESQGRERRLSLGEHSFVLADNDAAVDAAAAFLRSKGFTPRVLRGITGEARVVGARLARLLNRGTCFVAGGETTVTVRGHGVGGRSHELALDAAASLKRGVLLAAGTDGIDGCASHAGALVDASTKARAARLGCSAGAYLKDNDSNTFFVKTGDAIRTGPTGTNVCDLVIGIP
jgi:glycerate-2-kinase